MLGGFAVGKTSLVARYVRSIFSEKYLSTVGVKVDKKLVNVDGQDVMLMLWDVNGQDDFQPVQATHLHDVIAFGEDVQLDEQTTWELFPVLGAALRS